MVLKPIHLLLIKIVIHSAHAVSFLWLVVAVMTEQFGAEPVDAIIHFTGKAALNSLFITLLVSPIAKYFRLGALVRTRRLLGLYSFAWASIHLTSYTLFDLGLEISLLISEITTRPYLILGAITWLILLALSLTSPQKIQRKLGKHWQALHNLVYVSVLLAPIHYLWSVKSAIIEPSIYLLLACTLLMVRRDKIKRWLIR